MTTLPISAWPNYDHHTKQAISDRVDAYSGATLARVAELTEHQLKRVLVEVAPQQRDRLENFRRTNGHSNGHRLTTYLRRSFLATIAARRMWPGIEGLYQMGHVALAARCEAEFGAWVHKCAALGATCPRTFPRDIQARRQFIDRSIGDLRILLLELSSMAHRTLVDAGFDQCSWPIIGELYREIFDLKAH